MTSRHARIDAYYEACWARRFREGHNPVSGAMHFGDYEGGPSDSETAKLATNTVVERTLRERTRRPLRHLLDLGCGVGGSAAHLVRRNPDWVIDAIDRGAAQLTHAIARAESPQIHFVLADYEFLPVDAASRDGAYFIESLCHASDRLSVLKELARVLAEGAPVVVVDFFRTERAPAPNARTLYDAACDGFAVSDYFDAPLERCLEEAGFEHTRFEDRTEHILPGLERSRALASHRRAAHRDALERAHDATCLALGTLVEDGVLRYGVVSAVR